MKAKKILYIVTKSNQGGAQTYIRNIVTQLPRSFVPTVALGGNGWLKQELESKNVRTIVVEALGRDINFMQEIHALIALHNIVKKERPDILHVNSSKAGGLGAFIGRILGVQHIIFTAHGWAFNEDRNILQKILLKFFAWLTVLLSHTTITVSKTLKNQVVRLPFVKRKLVVIHNGIPQTQFLDRDSARAVLYKRHKRLAQHTSTKDVWIGVVSELHRNKGIDYAIEAMYELVQDHPKLRFIVMGEGDQRVQLENLIIEKRLSHNVFLLGHIKNAAKYLKALDIFLLSSRTEALATVLMEAGQASIPVVATAVGGIPEIVEDMRSGMLIKPRQPTEIARAVSYMLDHPKKRKKFGGELAARVQKHFHLERMIADTVSVYRK